MPRTKKPTGFKKVTHHYHRAWTNPIFKIINVVIFAAVFAWLGHYFFPSHAVTYPYEKPGLAGDDLGRVNSYRSSHGWSTLAEASCLDTIASHWAKSEATNNAIADPSRSWLSSQFNTYCSGHYWLSLGANDGFYTGATGSGAESAIFQNFLNSCLHLQNIADHGTNSSTVNKPAGGSCTFTSVGYNHIGTSAWVGSRSGGSLYIAQIFARW